MACGRKRDVEQDGRRNFEDGSEPHFFINHSMFRLLPFLSEYQVAQAKTLEILKVDGGAPSPCLPVNLREIKCNLLAISAYGLLP